MSFHKIAKWLLVAHSGVPDVVDQASKITVDLLIRAHETMRVPRQVILHVLGVSSSVD
jgi:hypothetical protein